MMQFIEGSSADFAALERRAAGRCVVFVEPMPPGSRPARARIGFERKEDGSVLLLVERGVSCPSAPESVLEWLREGEKRFVSFEELQRWLGGPLAAAYGVDEAARPASRPSRAASLTDLDAVRRGLSATPSSASHVEPGDLFAELSAEVHGQDACLRVLSHRIVSHLGRISPRKPATLFALGPTGVGKTRTAEVLAEVLSRRASLSDYRMIRLDMNEYKEPHRVSQLLGAPQGYVGYKDGTALADALAVGPRLVVLFDEIEKAHPSILQALMNAIDTGRLSSPSAPEHALDLRRAIFFFTSNIELSSGGDLTGAPHEVDNACRRALQRRGVAPELAGRIGTFLVFKPLTPEARAAIVTAQTARVAAEFGLTVRHIDPSAVVFLLARADEGAYGARPNEQLIDDLLSSAFAAAAQSGAVDVVVQGPPMRCAPSDPEG